MQSVNPATGETLADFAAHTDAEIEHRLARAAATFASYRRTSFEERARWLTAAADILEQEKEQLARTMTLEMGKLIGAARAEVEKCAWCCRYYAEHGAQFMADEPVPTDNSRSFIRYQPIGPVLAIMPWNFPFWQVFRFAAPALTAGNVGLLKHAGNVPQCALAIEDVLRRAGFPDGAFQTLLVGSDRVAGIIDDARVVAVTLTGSEGAGSAVAAQAGRQIKKTVLELGGSDPFIIMPGADLDDAVATAVTARTINNGQSCIAAKRFIVHADIAEDFTRRFVSAFAALRIGDPLHEDTDIGPLATRAIRDELHEQVCASTKAGARVLIGGTIVDGPGNFYAPTVLTDVPDTSPASRDELFGPVASVFTARDIDHAIAIANSTTFGLGAAAFTNDAAEQDRFIHEIEAGLVFINTMVASDPRLPFGGIKRSGYGRELGPFGMREFLNIKTVVVK